MALFDTISNDIKEAMKARDKVRLDTLRNIKKVFIPVENKIDLDVIPDLIKKKIEIILVRDYLEIYYYLFNNKDK